MIRVLHFADLHLGVENYGRLDPRTGLSTRLGDFLRALDTLVEYALENDIHLVLFAGDAYKGRKPSPTLQREFAKRIRQLAEAKILVFLLVGNHDMPRAASRATSVEIFDTLAIRNVWVRDLPGTEIIETKGGPVQVVALPWVNRGWLLSQEEHVGKNLLEIDFLIAEKWERIVENEIAHLDQRIPALLVAHGTVFGAVYGSERSVILGQEMVIPRSAVTDPAFDYVALGHIHKHQVLNENPPVVYAGSMERVDFGEEGEEKGFVVVEIEKGQARWEFIPLQARPFVTISVEAKGAEPMSQILEALSHFEVKEAVVRVLISTTAEAAPLIKDKEVRKGLGEAFLVATISKDVEQALRLRLGGRWVEEMPPQEVLERYLEAKRVPPERAKVLLAHARKIIEEESR
ncbi:MAG: exonuclease SbcCD subunit D [Anaerolineae bacterium]